MSSHWRTSLQKVQKGATARIELATSCTQSRNHTTRPRRLSRTLEPPVANRSARKRGKARGRRDRRIETQNVRPTSPANATPHLLGGPSRQRGNILSRAVWRLSTRASFARPARRGRADEGSVRTAPAPGRARGGRPPSRVRPSSGTARIRGRGVDRWARAGGEISSKFQHRTRRPSGPFRD